MLTRYLILAAAASVLVALPARRGHGAPLDLRLGVEGGLATLADPAGGRNWGQFGALHAALGITDRLGLQVLNDHKRFAATSAPDRVDTLGLALVYNIDVARVTPFVELGMAQVRLRWITPAQETTWSSTVASTGAGFDYAITQRLLLGAVVRYYALFDSALFDRPGYTTLQARLSVLLPLWYPRRMRP
ncbi:MAG: outer membrane beta-barrel protein [Myxococcota bacterium]